MAAERTSLLRVGLVLLLAAQVLPSVAGCNGDFYERMINDFCLAKFRFDMADLDPGLWCSWPDTTESKCNNGLMAGKKSSSCSTSQWIYEELTNCTFQVALGVDCFWPNQIVDRFFMNIHRVYFHDCALTGRLLHDPPIAILAPFIAVPVLITLLMTALVVWRSKRTEGVL